MSLREVYRLAHTAECRLNLSASRPDRNLRFVVGHLMHYESLRLRIVEIEHGIGKDERVRAMHSKSDGDAKTKQLDHDPTIDQQTPSAPYDQAEDEEEDFEDMDEYYEDEDTDGALSLTRFPSGNAHPPPLVEDDRDADIEEPPELPNQAILEQTLHGQADADLVLQLEEVRRCPCHGYTDASRFEHVWHLPASPEKPDTTRIIAQVAA